MTHSVFFTGYPLWIVAPLGLCIGWLYGKLTALGNHSLRYLGSGEPLPGIAAWVAGLLVINAYYIYPATFYGDGFGDIADAIEKWHRATFPIGNGTEPVGAFIKGFLWACLGLPVSAVVMFAAMLFYLFALILLPLAAIGCLITLPAAILGAVSALHLLFVPHPAEAIITPAIRRGEPIDHQAVAKVLEPDLTDIDLPPVFVSQNQAARAEALRRRVQADGELADEVVRRERRRMAAADAKRSKK